MLQGLYWSFCLLSGLVNICGSPASICADESCNEVEAAHTQIIEPNNVNVINLHPALLFNQPHCPLMTSSYHIIILDVVLGNRSDMVVFSLYAKVGN